LLSTPPRGDAVTFGYREWAPPERGLAPLRSRLLPGALIPAKAGIQKSRVWESASFYPHTFVPKVGQIRENLRCERAELAKLLFADPPDRSRIHAVARQILLHQSDLENEVIEHILEEREILTLSQQRKFYEIIVEQFSTGGLGVHDVRGME
jgi:hypothetical protein